MLLEKIQQLEQLKKDVFQICIDHINKFPEKYGKEKISIMSEISDIYITDEERSIELTGSEISSCGCCPDDEYTIYIKIDDIINPDNCTKEIKKIHQRAAQVEIDNKKTHEKNRLEKIERAKQTLRTAGVKILEEK